MIFRCVALLSLLTLAGCCATGVSCTTGAPGGGVAWDGLGSTPEENAISNDGAPTPPRSTSKKSQQQASRAQPSGEWDRQQASDQAADQNLTRQLKICSNC